MIGNIIMIMLGVYILISLVLVPVQYRYLAGLEAEQKRNGQNQSEYYQSKGVAEQVLHANAQGNPLFILANVTAYNIYKITH
ncbi:DUF3949 domain-containing protein [Gracilibacillus sp. D59]|uniref:DUF3949 domain-containing protein n=1 Tax=Gracilibacillus sp. D59 TaxID=3457434 RepID=UPI003FCD3705